MELWNLSHDRRRHFPPTVLVGEILPEHLSTTNPPVEGYVLAYDAATGKFKWVQAQAGVTMYPTFVANIVDVTPAANAHMLTILNRNPAKVIRVWSVNYYVSSETAVTGVLLKARAVLVTATAALSGGTAVTPVSLDPQDTLPTGIDIMSKPTSTLTVVGEVRRWLLSGDEAVVTTWDADALASELLPLDSFPVLCYNLPNTKPITLRTDGTTFRGFSIQHLTGTVGYLGASILFTVSDT